MDKSRRNRVFMLALAVLAVASLIGMRLYYLQVQRCVGLRARADNQRQRKVEVNATRGMILDRNGRELALSVATEALFVHPRKVGNPEEGADILAPLLALSRSEILERLRADKPFVFLSRFLERERADAVRASGLALGHGEPFGFLPSSKRYYPRGRLGVHVVGFANIDGVGVEGIEKQYDSVLRGEPVVYLVVQDGHRDVLSQAVLTPDTQPEDLVLSIDTVLQHVVERELERAMQETGAKAASSVLMDPTTGHVLALANRPAADPNRYGSARPEERINRAVVHQYEPGSTFKIVPMATALEHGKLRPNQLFDCENGGYALGRRTIRDVTPYRILSASQIMQRSSNIGMAKIARLMERSTLRDSMLRFGFGGETGIELPGELSGTVRRLAQWNDHSVASMAFGQEIGVTVIQMASAFAAVANDGVRMPPRLVLGKSSPEGRLTRFALPVGQRVIGDRTASELTAMLEGVINKGTGTRARLAGYRLAGKSGTAQKSVGGRYSEDEYVASFGGFGPLPVPRLVCLVVLDSPRGEDHGGGKLAAPVFRKIMRDALAYLRVPAEGEGLYLSTSVSRDGDGVTWPVAAAPALSRIPAAAKGYVPDVIGSSLREAVRRLAAHGCRVEVQGNGTVLAQHPAPGSPILPGSACRLQLGRRSTATRLASTTEPDRGERRSLR